MDMISNMEYKSSARFFKEFSLMFPNVLPKRSEVENQWLKLKSKYNSNLELHVSRRHRSR